MPAGPLDAIVGSCKDRLALSRKQIVADPPSRAPAVRAQSGRRSAFGRGSRSGDSTTSSVVVLWFEQVPRPAQHPVFAPAIEVDVLARAGMEFPSWVCNSTQRPRSHLGMVNGCRRAFVNKGSRGFVASVPPLSACMSTPPRSWFDSRMKSSLPPASARGRASGAVLPRNPDETCLFSFAIAFSAGLPIFITSTATTSSRSRASTATWCSKLNSTRPTSQTFARVSRFSLRPDTVCPDPSDVSRPHEEHDTSGPTAVSGQSFPIIFTIVGATLVVALLHLISGRRAEPDARSTMLSSVWADVHNETSPR